MRAGAGDARRDYGRQRRWREERHPVQDGGFAGGDRQGADCRTGQNRHDYERSDARDGCAPGGRHRRKRPLGCGAVTGNAFGASAGESGCAVCGRAGEKGTECVGFRRAARQRSDGEARWCGAPWRQREVHAGAVQRTGNPACGGGKALRRGQNAPAVQPRRRDSRHDGGRGHGEGRQPRSGRGTAQNGHPRRDDYGRQSAHGTGGRAGGRR